MLLAGVVQAGEVVRVASGEWVPYSGREIPEQGFCSHVVREAFMSAGYTVEFEYFPWKKAYQLAEDGKFDATLCWVEAEERKASFLFSDPIATEKVVFFHRKDFDFDWAVFDDLARYKIGATLGYNYGEAFQQAEAEKRIVVERVNKDELNLKKLLRGRIDLYPIEFTVGHSLIIKTFKPTQAAMLTNHTRPLRVTQYHLLISRALPGNRAEELLAAFNAGLQALHESGTYETMSDRLFDGQYDPD